MQCPRCPESSLVMTDRQNIEIDYCPTCRGVWLDRGELDKLIERSTPAAPASFDKQHTGHPPDFADSDYRQGRHRSGGRKKSWLSDIFD